MEGLRLWHLEKLRAGEDGLVVKGLRFFLVIFGFRGFGVWGLGIRVYCGLQGSIWFIGCYKVLQVSFCRVGSARRGT